MTHDDLTFLPLRVTRVGVGGKRSFDPAHKRRLVEACLKPEASLSGLALKAGVNANQLHKWVRLHEPSEAPAKEHMSGAWSTFVPAVAIDDPVPLPSLAPAPGPVQEPESVTWRMSRRSTSSARLSAQLPSGAKFEIEFSGYDVELVSAMIAALGAC